MADPDPTGSDFEPRPIPDLLHSAYEEGPFRSCTVCGDVLTDGRLYEIQKVFRGTEAIFEMAICHTCGEGVAREFSEQSMESVRRFLEEHFRPAQEGQHCNFCGFPRGVVQNYTIVGACREHSLVLPSLVMCEKCTERVQEELSQKTRDAHDDFVRDHFPGVPADLDVSPIFGIG